eukprot:gene36381-biopygen3823
MVYSIIKRQLSRQSLARVQAHNDYEAVDNLRDPNRLWQIVISTHLLNVREKFIEKLDLERYGTTQLNYRNKVYDKPRSVQEAFEFLNTLAIPKKTVRNVFYQNGQSDRDGERTKSNGGRRGNQGTAEQNADKDKSKTSSKKEKNQSKKRTNLLVLPADILDDHDLSGVSGQRADEAPRQRPDEDVFRVQMTHDSPEYMFERKLGIYVVSASSKARQEEVYVTTVEDTKKAFTKYEVERANRARELLSRLGYPSTAKAIQMLNSGGIINCDITSSDLLRAEEIYGPPIASLKGKTVKNTATPNKDEEPVIGARDGTWYLFNLNSRKLVKRKKFTIIPMPDVVINFLNNLHDIDEAGDESDINFQIDRKDKKEIDGALEEMTEDEAYQDQVAKRFITVREHDMIYDPVEASQPDIIEQTEAPTTSDSVDLEGVVEVDALQPEDNAGSVSSSKDDHLESYEPRRDGLRSASRAKPGRYTLARKSGCICCATQTLLTGGSSIFT